MSTIDQNTGIIRLEEKDADWVKILFDEYIPPGTNPSNYTKGLLDGLLKFFNEYLNDPRDIYSGLNTSGGSVDLYKVRVSEDDIENYLGDKIRGLNGIEVSISGITNKVVDISLDIQESGSTSVFSMLSDPSTLKKYTEGLGIKMVSTSDELEIGIDEAFLENITYGIKYAWDSEAEMFAETGMSDGDLGVRNDLGEVWKYDEAILEWEYFFDLGTSTTEKTTVSSVTTESFSGVQTTQQGVNEENVNELYNIYNILLGNSPAFGDLIGDPLPQDVPATETVATWSTVKQSTNEDVWEFNDTDNEILIKKAGFYTWNTQIDLTNSSNQTRFLVFSTRNKNDNTEVFYTRYIEIPRNGANTQTSITFEVPNDNTTMEITIQGHNGDGNPNDDLTIIDWTSSLLLNFVLNPEANLTTDLIEVVDVANESPTGTATTQKGVNEDVTTSIESNQSAINFNASNIYDLDLRVTDNESDISNLRQTPLVYNKVVFFDENNDGEIYINQISVGFYQFRITKNNNDSQFHKQFETLKKGAIFNVFKKFEDTLFSCEIYSTISDFTNYIEFTATFTNGVDPSLLTDEVVLDFVNDIVVIEEVTTENVTVSDPTNESLSESAADQSDINIENKISIRELEENFGKVFVDGDDTGAEYLTDKLAPGDNITITEEVDAGGEKLLRIASTGGASVSELSGAFVKTDYNYDAIIQEVSNDTWEILDIGSFTVLDSVDFDTDIIWDDTNKRILNNGTTTKTVKVSFTTNILLNPEGSGVLEDNLLVAVRDSNANIITSSYLRQSDATNLNDSKLFSGSYTLELTPNNWLRLECFRNLVTASSDYIWIYDFTFSAVEIGNSSTTGGSGLDENVKASDTDTTAGKLIDKLAEGSNVTLTVQDEGGDEKVLITASGEVSTIVKQGVNYYNSGSDICNNDGAGTGVQIVNVNSIQSNGSGWLMKSPNGNVLTDIPTVDFRTYAAGLSPAVPLLDNTKAIKMTLRTGNCRVKDPNRNDKTGIAYVEINLFSLDNQSITSANHQLVGTYKLMDTFGANNTGVVGANNTSNNYVTFELTNLNGIVSLDSDLSYGFTISGTNDQNPPVSNEKIYLMESAILTVLYEGEVL